MAAAEHRRISVIVPALNEAAGIAATLARLQPLRARGHEVIVVDGGSEDTTLELAQGKADLVMQAPRGRARQMNAGAGWASGDILWFLHADTCLSGEPDRLILAALRDGRRSWGRFDVTLQDGAFPLGVVACCMNLRSRLTGIATGDQGIFMTRAAYAAIGGYQEIPLMEDIAASRALKRLSRPACLDATLATSARRWHAHGVTRTILTMWGLRLAYFCGVPARRLARYYGMAMQ